MDKAVAAFSSAVALLRSRHALHSSFASEVCGALGDAHFEAEEAGKAVEAFEMACQAAEANEEMANLALLLTKRGLALAFLGDLQNALKDHEQARALAEEHGFLQSSLGADVLVNMAIAKARGWNRA